MVSEDNEVVADHYPFIRIYKNGRVERFYHLHNFCYIPPAPDSDPVTDVSSKDVTINSHVSARLYLPKTINQKLPIIVFYHGGGLILGSAFFNKFHHFLNLLVSESKSIAVSVDYRLAPEHDVSTVYEDSWTALQWVASSQDSWLTSYGDFDKVFIFGESGGANIAFNMAMRAGREKLNRDVKLNGSILACPYFVIPHENVDVENSAAYELWSKVICPKLGSPFDCPMINPLCKTGPSLSELGCSKLLMCMVEKDEMVPGEIQMKFVEGLKKSGWNGEFMFILVEGESHSFFIENPDTERATDLIKQFASFVQCK
ncbi:hypothetical protein HAX54_019686 [Datura stramonium]|uniref:Alpha/beta hydrolase fold-3 domain-containing protein n=1 Tax=Datura stramonium TaxID=4076 RepID=A0ABS8UQV1_DATST|nr:hypothetical protein [Datura stramonium]